MKEAGGKLLKYIISYCYGYYGYYRLSFKKAIKTLEIATLYKMPYLERACWNHIKDHYMGNRIVDIFVMADRYGNDEVRKIAYGTICSNLNNISTQYFMKLDSHLMHEILSNDDIEADEELLYEILVSWLNHDEAYRINKMPDLLKLIRLENFPKYLLVNRKVKYQYRKYGLFDTLTAARPSGNLKRRKSVYRLTIYNGRLLVYEKYHPALRKFEEVRRDELPYRCQGSNTFVQFNDKLYIFSDHIDGVEKKYAYVYCGSDRQLPQMLNSCRTNTDKICRRNNAVVFGHHIYVFESICQRFDTIEEKWETVQSPCENPIVSVVDGVMYATNNGTDELYTFDPTTDGWHKTQTGNPNAIVIGIDGVLYTIGDYIFKLVGNKFEKYTYGTFGVTNAIDVKGGLLYILNNGYTKLDEFGVEYTKIDHDDTRYKEKTDFVQLFFKK